MKLMIVTDEQAVELSNGLNRADHEGYWLNRLVSNKLIIQLRDDPAQMDRAHFLLVEIIKNVRQVSRQCLCSLDEVCTSCKSLMEAKKQINELTNLKGFEQLG